MIRAKNKPEKSLTLGILGGGQLAKMLAQAAYRMGLHVAVIENHAGSPAGDLTKLEFSKGWDDEEELDRFIEVSDIITLENEFIDPELLRKISKKKPVFPTAGTMELVQDKFIQKTTFREAGLPLPDFEEAGGIDDLKKFGKKHGYPFVIKARKYGYDGYGNATAFSENDAIEAWVKFNGEELKRPLMAESFVDFTKELAVIIARGQNGEKAVYPCVETVQYRHICHEVIAPAAVDEAVLKEAREIALKAVESVNGTGVFGVELFLTKSGRVLVNEIAPRPHNSGHYTIEACHTSQFENGIRAALGLPLGSPEMIAPAAAMVNLLGTRHGSGVPADVVEMLRHREAALHLYNKKSSRTGRKMGHVTALGSNSNEAFARAKSAADAINW